MAKKPIPLDDGFRPDIGSKAMLDGIFEMPMLSVSDINQVPKKLIPFSVRNRTTDYCDTVVFYEKDRMFSQLLASPESYIKDLKRFSGGMISPDCSVYRDSPLSVQIANTYRNRLLGVFFQSHGINVIPNVRWGDARSYTSCLFADKFAFAGIPKNGIVSVGTYGCIRGKENRYHFVAGFDSMMTSLTPKVVIIYGAFPADIRNRYETYVKFVVFPNWISLKRNKEA